MGFFRNTRQTKRVDEAVTEQTIDPELAAAGGPAVPAGGEQEADAVGGLNPEPVDHNKGIARILCPGY